MLRLGNVLVGATVVLPGTVVSPGIVVEVAIGAAVVVGSPMVLGSNEATLVVSVGARTTVPMIATTATARPARAMRFVAIH